MGDIENLLSDYKKGGHEDSTGVFTIDFQAAREKLSKFQLADPHEFLLKFVQAGNLAANDIQVELGSKSNITLRGWSSELTLEKLAERLASTSLIVGDDPLTHLCIGLSALLGLVPEGIRLCHRVEGSKMAKLLDLGTTLEWKDIESNPENGSSLRIWWPGVAEISQKTLAGLLRERCTYSAVPIALNGAGLLAVIPKTPGAHREKFFRKNETLSELRTLRASGDAPPMADQRSKAKTKTGAERDSHLRLTVDLDPVATIWMVKAGVMTQKKRMELGVPGLVGAVFADDLATDLTGSQFLENATFDEIRVFLKEVGVELLEDALTDARQIGADAQPASATAPIGSLIGCSACLLAVLGFFATIWMIGPSNFRVDWGAATFMFWLVSPVPMVWWAIKRHGCEKDKNSDKAAKDYLVSVLDHALHRLR